MKNSEKIGLCIIIGMSALGIIGALVSFFLKIPTDITSIIATWVGILGTAASVVLSVIAMVYSDKSSKEAAKSLEQVNEYYRAMCQQITNHLVEEALGPASLEELINQ